MSNAKNRYNSAIFYYFSVIIKLVRELVTSNMQNKIFVEDIWNTFQVTVPTSKC